MEDNKRYEIKGTVSGTTMGVHGRKGMLLIDVVFKYKGKNGEYIEDKTDFVWIHSVKRFQLAGLSTGLGVVFEAIIGIDWDKNGEKFHTVKKCSKIKYVPTKVQKKMKMGMLS